MSLFCDYVEFILCLNCKKCEASAVSARCWSCTGASVVHRAKSEDRHAVNQFFRRRAKRVLEML